MDEQDIIVKINRLKERVKEIVLNIQGLKKQLEKSEISLEGFREKKSILENELRNILHNISQLKENIQIQIKPQANIPITKEKAESSRKLLREIQFADEAKELMYFFQTDFEESITRARVYLSITLEDHFVIGVDFSNYPQRPILEIPSEIIKIFNGDKDLFLSNLPTYMNWDPENPKRIFELVTEIETVLINSFSADLNTILKKSVEYVEQAKKTLEKMTQEAKAALSRKEYDKAIQLYYSIIEMSYDIQDYERAEFFTKRLNDILKSINKDNSN
ncbi:MAG: hypothetical protein ACTSQJ_03615 [Promethearchaeota archaeon]